MTEKACPLCQQRNISKYYDSVWNSVKKQVMLCLDCKSFFLYPTSTSEEQRKFDEGYDGYIRERELLVSGYTDEPFESLVDTSIQDRFEDLAAWFTPGVSVLEVGAEKGGFLDRLSTMVGDIHAVDACPEYANLLAKKGYTSYRYIWDLPKDLRFDRICFFSLLEHILDPLPFLAHLRKYLSDSGFMVIEIPSANEPLLSLYDVEAFKAFYFQAMHPYVYSLKGAKSILARAGLEITKIKYKQRYGLENHLNWLKEGAPGGSRILSELFGEAVETAYIKELEKAGITDTMYLTVRRSV